MSMKIDFVVPWVDGSDPAWQTEFKKHHQDSEACDASFKRYRDWELLKYWFRGVEKNAPWVNKIYFITWGHVPQWLDVNHPKLVIVKHEDYIPTEYLPTFSSHPIELNMHRIEELSEHFVYFNDDLFLIDKVNESDFFVNGLPCDMGGEFPIFYESPVISNIHINNILTINKHFKKYEVIKKNLFKWFNPLNKALFLCNILLLPWNRFVGMYCHHYAQPLRKSTMNEVWDIESGLLHSTSSNKFRSKNDVNQYIFKMWNICKGEYNSVNKRNHAKLFPLNSSNYNEVCQFIEAKSKPLIVINDEDDFGDKFDLIKKSISASFDKILPKSSFEI